MPTPFSHKDGGAGGAARDGEHQGGGGGDAIAKINYNRRKSSSVATAAHPPSEGKGVGSTGFLIRPNIEDRFDRLKAETIMEEVIKEFMRDKPSYVANEAADWSDQIAHIINNRVKELNFQRYKIVSHITIGEQIGGGIHIGMKCLWDAETDVYANFSYMTDTMFVVGTVCGVFYY